MSVKKVHMKNRIVQISLIILLFSAFACKEDEDVSASIVGKWQGDQSEIKVTYGLVTLHEEEDDQFDALLEFKDDGSVSFTNDGTTTTGTYELKGTKLSINAELQFDGVNISSATFDVLELSQTKLRLHLEQDQEVNVPDLGNVNTTVKANFSFDRL
jgi:hypothetical protein